MKRKINNKGITLVELLVALAVGSIVISAVIILLKQGITGYTNQTISAQLQDDANITLNQMSDAIMQAKCVDIYNEISGDGNTPNFITNRGTDGNAYSYDQINKILYVGTKTNTDYSKLGILCQHVTKFKVQILNSSVKTDAVQVLVAGVPQIDYKIVGVSNPIQIKVTLTLEYGGLKREVSRVTALRNEIHENNVKTDFTIQGMNVESFPYKSALAAYFTD